MAECGTAPPGQPFEFAAWRLPRHACTPRLRPKKWVIDGHTRAKHQILEKYLAAWFPILSTYNGRVLYIDGFAGRGRYEDGSEGSPQLALRTLIDHPILTKRTSCEFLFMYIEKNAENAAALEAELQAMEDSGVVPPNVQWGVVNSSFDDQMQQLCDRMEAQGKNRVPTFAFIDPFGSPPSPQLHEPLTLGRQRTTPRPLLDPTR